MGPHSILAKFYIIQVKLSKFHIGSNRRCPTPFTVPSKHINTSVKYLLRIQQIGDQDEMRVSSLSLTKNSCLSYFIHISSGINSTFQATTIGSLYSLSTQVAKVSSNISSYHNWVSLQSLHPSSQVSSSTHVTFHRAGQRLNASVKYKYV